MDHLIVNVILDLPETDSLVKTYLNVTIQILVTLKLDVQNFQELFRVLVTLDGQVMDFNVVTYANVKGLTIHVMKMLAALIFLDRILARAKRDIQVMD